MALRKIISMVITKKQILQKINESEFLTRKGNFASRVCKLIKDGEFNSAFSSQKLTDLLNEGFGKKVRANNLTALMPPLLREDIVKIKIVGRGRNKRKYWFPAWIDKRIVENELSLGSLENATLFLTGNEAWTDSNKNFPGIINMLDGDLCIVDPFYGNGTFFTLSKFGKERKIRFLSAKLGDEEQNNITNFNINLKKFKKEFQNIKLKKYDKIYELHDRYIIADNALVVVGYGIKDFGNKESFVVFLPRKTVAKFLPALKAIFEKRWEKSNDIK
jgi:hypothetical protein